jgi:hypothetical protein
MFCWQPCKDLSAEENAEVTLGRALALSGLNNTRSSQAKEQQQKYVEYKTSAAVEDKDTTTCTSTSMQAWDLDNQSWCVASYCVPCTEYPQCGSKFEVILFAFSTIYRYVNNFLALSIESYISLLVQSSI